MTATAPGRPGGAMVEFDGVGLRYGPDAETLSDISFNLQPGSFYFLTGASGAGKTSLLKMLYLAQRPSRGIVRLFGEDLGTMPRQRLPGFRRRIGVVFQDFRLIPHLSARDNIALPLRIAGVSEEDLSGPVGEMLSWIGLSERAHAFPPTLSGGEQQRVAIARAVIARNCSSPTSRRVTSIPRWRCACWACSRRSTASAPRLSSRPTTSI